MSKASKLASLATDVNELTDLADSVTEIEDAIERANTNSELINELADISSAMYNSGISYSTDGVNEYYDATTVSNTLANVDLIEINAINPADGEILAYNASANNWINSPAPEEPSPVLSFRNKIINGGMYINQRNPGTVTTAGSFPVDRFQMLHATNGTFSAQQDFSDQPNGFLSSLKWTATSAADSFASTHHAIVRQRIEGTNIYDLQFGSATAETITLSFWVKSSLTGVFGGSIMNNGQTRCYPFSYTIDTADTWEYKTIVISGDTDTSIIWQVDTGIGFELFWSMGVGSDYKGATTGAWTSTPYQYSVADETPIMGTLNATWQISGVQLEKGEVATPFEHRPYGLELSLCQRYCEAIDINQMTSMYSSYLGKHYLTCEFKTTKRVAPSATSVAITNYQPGGGTGTAVMEGNGLSSARIYTGSNNSNFLLQYINNGHTNEGAIMMFDAEL